MKAGDMKAGDIIIWKNDPDYLAILVEIGEEHWEIKPLSPPFIEELRECFGIKGNWLITLAATVQIEQWKRLC